MNIELANDAEIVRAILRWRELTELDRVEEDHWNVNRLYFMLPEER